MLGEWTAACGEEDPAILVPWADQETGLRFVDLRAEPYDLPDITEAEAHPALRRALRSLNAPRSAFFTSKCDLWLLSPEDGGDKLEALRLELDLADEEAAFGCSSYLDIVWRERAIFASAHQASERLARIARRATRLSLHEAALEAVLRPSLVDLGTPLEGFAATLYVTAVAGDPETAYRRWEAALDAILPLLREREHTLPPGAATIDGTRASSSTG